jgi:hypothetical protein
MYTHYQRAVVYAWLRRVTPPAWIREQWLSNGGVVRGHYEESDYHPGKANKIYIRYRRLIDEIGERLVKGDQI